MKWELEQLEDAVRNAHGDLHADAIHEPLQSLIWKSEMAYYHACAAEELLKDAVAEVEGITEDDPPSVAAGKAVLIAAAPGEAGQELRFAKFKAEAHVIASAQALHSLCDIMCHVVYWACKLDTAPNPPATNRLNLHSVVRTLNLLPQYSTTAALIQEVVDSPEFRYLVGYVNTTKHNSLVKSTMSAAFDEDRGGIRIKAFTYTDPRGNVHNFDQKWAHDFVLPENQAVRLKLLAVGHSLNGHFV
ncbi:MAG: hypothetical protein ABGZ53_05990 [Fuerstiella sp.]